MELIEKYRWPVFFGAAVILLGVLIGASSNNAANDTNKKSSKESTSQQKPSDKTVKNTTKTEASVTGSVTYTARSGDSYTVLARKAVQAYAHDANITLKPAQIIAAETHLTVDASSPYLNYGQKVTFSKTTVSKAVKNAQALTAAELAAWQAYVPYVIFDTSQNG